MPVKVGTVTSGLPITTSNTNDTSISAWLFPPRLRRITIQIPSSSGSLISPKLSIAPLPAARLRPLPLRVENATRVTGDQSPPLPRRRRPLQPTDANTPLQSTTRQTRSQSPTKAAKKIQLDEEYSGGDWGDGAMPTPTVGRSPDCRWRTRTASPPRPRLTNIAVLSSRSSEYDYADTASSTASGTSSKRDSIAYALRHSLLPIC
jgi:hypothetical protein